MADASAREPSMVIFHELEAYAPEPSTARAPVREEAPEVSSSTPTWGQPQQGETGASQPAQAPNLTLEGGEAPFQPTDTPPVAGPSQARRDPIHAPLGVPPSLGDVALELEAYFKCVTI